jgi:hypothetical protein
MADNPLLIKFESAGVMFNTSNGKPLTIQVTKVSGGSAKFMAYIYQCHLNEDIDGAPMAYGWDNPTNLFAPGPHIQRNLHPIENGSKKFPGQQNGLMNAASTDGKLWVNHLFHWAGVMAATPDEARAGNWVIDRRAPLRDVNGRFPVVQGPGAPAPGYYVSTSGQPADASITDQGNQNRYINASEIPYAVYANNWKYKLPKVLLGDFGVAIRNNTGVSCGFFFGDTGTNDHVGESSQKLFRTLSPSGYNEDLVSFIVFPGSGAGFSTAAQRMARLDWRVSIELERLNLVPNSQELIKRLAHGGQEQNIKRGLQAAGFQPPRPGTLPIPNEHGIEGDFENRRGTSFSRVG